MSPAPLLPLQLFDLGSLPEWTALAPTLVLGLTALALLGIDSISPDTRNNAALAGTTALGSFVALAFTGAGKGTIKEC